MPLLRRGGRRGRRKRKEKRRGRARKSKNKRFFSIFGRFFFPPSSSLSSPASHSVFLLASPPFSIADEVRLTFSVLRCAAAATLSPAFSVSSSSDADAARERGRAPLSLFADNLDGVSMPTLSLLSFFQHSHASTPSTFLTLHIHIRFDLSRVHQRGRI